MFAATTGAAGRPSMIMYCSSKDRCNNNLLLGGPEIRGDVQYRCFLCQGPLHGLLCGVDVSSISGDGGGSTSGDGNSESRTKTAATTTLVCFPCHDAFTASSSGNTANVSTTAAAAAAASTTTGAGSNKKVARKRSNNDDSAKKKKAAAPKNTNKSAEKPAAATTATEQQPKSPPPPPPLQNPPQIVMHEVKKHRAKSVAGKKRGIKQGGVHRRDKLTKEDWYQICTAKDSCDANRQMTNVAFLKSPASGNRVSGTLSEQVSFSKILRAFRRGELVPTSKLRNKKQKRDPASLAAAAARIQPAAAAAAAAARELQASNATATTTGFCSMMERVERLEKALGVPPHSTAAAAKKNNDDGTSTSPKRPTILQRLAVCETYLGSAVAGTPAERLSHLEGEMGLVVA